MDVRFHIDSMEHLRPNPKAVTLSFEEFANFIRKWAAIPERMKIAPETLFEDDLGITGDDGCELLEEIERHFAFRLSSSEHGYRQTFDLPPNEFLFNSEGFGPSPSGIVSLFDPSAIHSSIRPFSVGELFNAVKNAPVKAVTCTSILGLEG